jgi:hypothetical protein
MGWGWGVAMCAALSASWCAATAAVPAQVGQDIGHISGVARWVLETRDHQGRPFAIVDKKRALIHVYDGAGRLKGASAALVGETPGDHTVPGVGDRTAAGHVPLHQRTTPSGRFQSEPGRNLRGEHVVWVDYDSAFAIHRVRPGPQLRQRQARLASESPADNRASLGCVVVPVSFYRDVVLRMLGHSRGVVYVLPEQGSALDFFRSH